MNPITRLFQPLVLTAWAISTMPQPAACAEYSEYDVKAECIGIFLQGIKWPAKAFADESAPFIIGICGSDPFGGKVGGPSVGGRNVVVKKSKRIEDLASCHLIFVSKSESARIGEILGALRGTNALTVGEAEGFAGKGGIINFVIEDGKVHYELNPAAARRSGLEISAKIVRLGKLVSS